MPPLEYRGGSHTPAHPSTTTRLLDFYFGPTATARYNYHFTGVTTIINYETRVLDFENRPTASHIFDGHFPPAAAEAVPNHLAHLVPSIHQWTTRTLNDF